MIEKKVWNKGLDFVKYAISNGHDLFHMASDKAYMQQVVDKYYEDLDKERNVVND